MQNLAAKVVGTANVNIAPNSTAGHFVEASPVVELSGVKEDFFVERKSLLKTHNHQSLPMDDKCHVFPQNVYNPFSKEMERSKD